MNQSDGKLQEWLCTVIITPEILGTFYVISTQVLRQKDIQVSIISKKFIVLLILSYQF